MKSQFIKSFLIRLCLSFKSLSSLVLFYLHKASFILFKFKSLTSSLNSLQLSPLLGMICLKFIIQRACIDHLCFNSMFIIVFCIPPSPCYLNYLSHFSFPSSYDTFVIVALLLVIFTIIFLHVFFFISAHWLVAMSVSKSKSLTCGLLQHLQQDSVHGRWWIFAVWINEYFPMQLLLSFSLLFCFLV